MAMNVTAQVLGQGPRLLDNVATIAQVKAQLGVGANYSAVVNGETARDDFRLSDYQNVTLSPAVKGG